MYPCLKMEFTSINHLALYQKCQIELCTTRVRGKAFAAGKIMHPLHPSSYKPPTLPAAGLLCFILAMLRRSPKSESSGLLALFCCFREKDDVAPFIL
uniref:Uncharacterized protein n=1 Tax=Triticum urartu TaxID=4572 RepID=A0A8R7QGI0_TRIUA